MMSLFIRLNPTLVLFFSFCTFAFGQSPQIISHKNDSLLVARIVQAQVEQKQFSGAILVAKDGATIYRRSFGIFGNGLSDSLENDYHYAIASVTKLFTSIRILQLVEDGRVNLTRPAVSYLPKFSHLLNSNITIHHLLLHISGLPNENDQVYQRSLRPEEIVYQTLKERSATKIDHFNYNNLDYMLLGLLIEEVTGHSWQEEITAYILSPLQLDMTGFLQHGKYPENFAHAHSYYDGIPVLDPLIHMENYYAAGCMYATALDLLRLDQALYEHKLLSKESYALLSTSYPEYNYVGYGVWNYQYPFSGNKPTVMERRGGILGANVVLIRMTDTKHTIIILSNNDRFNPDSFGDADNFREALMRLF